MTRSASRAFEALYGCTALRMSLETPCGFDRGHRPEPSIGVGQRTERRLNVRAIRHLYEFVARNARAVRRVHLFPADLAVHRILIGADGFLVRNFIQSTAMRALKGLRH